MAPGGTEKELAEIYGAAGDVAADQVRVHVLEGAWGKDAAGENAIAKAGGETLDLRFERIEHVDSGTVGDVAVGPCNVLPCRSARGIEEAGLREEDEGPLRMTGVSHVVFGRGNFLEAAAKMDSGGARAVRRFPGNGAVESVIDFEDGGTVAIFRQVTGESHRKTIARDAQQLVRRDVAENGVVVFERG